MTTQLPFTMSKHAVDRALEMNVDGVEIRACYDRPENVLWSRKYRVIADRDKGDDPQWDDVRLGDRTTSVVISGEGQGSMTHLVRIERPMPTTVEHKAVNTLNLGYYRTKVECSCGGSWWFGEHEGDPTHDEAKTAHLQPSPHPPTREQIAEAIEQDQRVQTWHTIWAYVCKHQPQPVGDERTAEQYVLALLQNGADR
jgi:hypothetical protein